jgi:hypothetical protein
MRNDFDKPVQMMCLICNRFIAFEEHRVLAENKLFKHAEKKHPEHLENHSIKELIDVEYISPEMLAMYKQARKSDKFWQYLDSLLK